MIEIIIALIVMTILMARNRGRKRRYTGRKWIKGTVLDGLVLGTLNASTAIVSTLDTVTERSYIASAWLLWSIRGATAGEGPIRVGLMHSDYTAAELEEYLEATNSWAEADLVAQEVSNRRIREVGIFSNVGTEEVLNDGRMIKTKLGWILNAGQTIDVWAYNASGAQLATGQVVGTAGHVWLQPK